MIKWKPYSWVLIINITEGYLKPQRYEKYLYYIGLLDII